jgi:hypothetical protein
MISSQAALMPQSFSWPVAPEARQPGKGTPSA